MDQQFKILIVEDSEDQQKILIRMLTGYVIKCVSSAEEASSLIKEDRFDLVLIDINLPKRSGFSLLSEIQGDTDKRCIPALCISGRSDVTDKVTAFSLGADDYITKPFDPIELRARIDSRLKKVSRQVDNHIVVVGDIQIDTNRHRVSITIAGDQKEVILTQTEFKLLYCLSRRPEQVYTRDQLLVAAWGEDARVLDRVVDTHICLLRKKLGSHSHYIKSVTGVGYKIVPRSKIREAV